MLNLVVRMVNQTSTVYRLEPAMILHYPYISSLVLKLDIQSTLKYHGQIGTAPFSGKTAQLVQCFKIAG